MACNNSFPDDSLKIVEKVYLHTDRDLYNPGDDIWFKAYLIDATVKLLTDHSYNLHVELISPASEIIDSRIIRLGGGIGNGDFHLFEKLHTGEYRIRAYTNYMRNFSDELFFNKEITIIDPANAINPVSDSVTTSDNNIELSFFPEGGSLVDNVPSVVAFKALDAAGKGCDISGEVFSSEGELVTTFRSIHKGMGAFSLQPFHGGSYYAAVKMPDGKEVRYMIPLSFPKGFVLHLLKTEYGETEAIIRTNEETLNEITDKDLALSISSHGTTFSTVSFKINSVDSFLNLFAPDLPEGIVSLTLTDIDGKPLCERLVYIHDQKDFSLNVETDKTLYNQRDSVSVRLSVHDPSELPPLIYVSLSAINKVSEKSTSGFPSTIASWFFLESEIRGKVEDPSYYFDQANTGRMGDLDILLLTQGWRDFEWKYQNNGYQPEYGFSVAGRIRKKFADIPIRNATVNIGIFTSGRPVFSFVSAVKKQTAKGWS